MVTPEHCETELTINLALKTGALSLSGNPRRCADSRIRTFASQETAPQSIQPLTFLFTFVRAKIMPFHSRRFPA
jgi:hypothetical protein